MLNRITQNWWKYLIGLAVTVLAVIVVSRASSDAAVGLVGVVVGAAATIAFQYVNSSTERRHQLRMAALDKRLEVHQEAFALWRELYRHLNDRESLGPIIINCENWWEKHCLYLSPDARAGFSQAYHLASMYHQAGDSARQYHDKILDVAQLIVKGVELPTVGKDEGKFVED